MDYSLLPFRFERIEDSEIIVNEVGDFLICPTGTSKNIVERNIKEEDSIYKDLIANHIISIATIPALIDNLAARYRTKKAFLDSITHLCNDNPL